MSIAPEWCRFSRVSDEATCERSQSIKIKVQSLRAMSIHCLMAYGCAVITDFRPRLQKLEKWDVLDQSEETLFGLHRSGVTRLEVDEIVLDSFSTEVASDALIDKWNGVDFCGVGNSMVMEHLSASETDLESNIDTS